MSVLAYSTTAASNTTISGISIAEGMLRANVNDAIRQELADIAKMYGDAETGVATTGSANAYLLTTNNVHSAYANTTAGRFRANFTNTGAATINVDGLGVKNVQKYDSSGLVAVVANDIRQNGVYDWAYDTTTGVVVLLSPTQAQVSTVGRTLIAAGNSILQGSTLKLGLVTATTGGTTAYAVSLSGSASYQTSEAFWVRVNATATGSVTLNRDAIGAKSVMIYNAAIAKVAAAAIDWIIGCEYFVAYDGTDYVILDARIHRGISNGNIPQRGADGFIPYGVIFNIYSDSKASGTDGGGITAATDTTRALQTAVAAGISGVTLASNQITVPAGTYEIDAWTTTSDCQNSKSWLHNVTDAAVAVDGSGSFTGTALGQNFVSVIKGLITPASTKVYEIRSRSAATKATTGLGNATAMGHNEIYTMIKIMHYA